MIHLQNQTSINDDQDLKESKGRTRPLFTKKRVKLWKMKDWIDIIDDMDIWMILMT